MKILERGNIPKRPIFLLRGRCPNCNCLVECSEGDSDLIHDLKPNPCDSIYKVKCPTKDCCYYIKLQGNYYHFLNGGPSIIDKSLVDLEDYISEVSHNDKRINQRCPY